MNKLKLYFSNLFYKPYGVKITISFPSGETRKYYLTDSAVSDVARGAMVRLEFVYPKYGEFAKISLREPILN